jgi:predicted metal-binding protein
LLPQYAHGVFYFEKFAIKGDYLELGKKSSLKIYRKIVLERSKLLKDGHHFTTGFGAGSCKLCDECSFPCPNPERALVPLEATGVNIVNTLKRYGITLKFPVKKYFYRIGALFYD